MAAPRHIVDALESVLSIYFSNCRHKERPRARKSDRTVEQTVEIGADERIAQYRAAQLR